MTLEADALRRYGVIIADPPWPYRFQVPGKHRKPQEIYSPGDSDHATMTAEEIAAIPVGSWAADDCVLLLWTTWPQLEEGFHVMKAWGATFKTGFMWAKTTAMGLPWQNTGVWVQGVTEPLLVGCFGSPGPRGKAMIGFLTGEGRAFYAPRRAHSSKPKVLHDYAEQFEGPYLELFARRERPGWSTWGNELGFKLGPKGVEACEPTRERTLFDG